jgi:hypothetical protein
VNGYASIYRFVDKGSWAVDWISRCLFLFMVEALAAEGLDVLAVLDDTLNKHRGPEICGAGWQHDGSAPKRPGKKGEKGKQTGYGVCFVLMGLAIRLPVEGIQELEIGRSQGKAHLPPAGEEGAGSCVSLHAGLLCRVAHEKGTGAHAL